MDINLVNSNFDKLLKEDATKDNVYKIRDAINYTKTSGLNNLNKLLDAIKADGSSDLHKTLCNKVYMIGTSIDYIFSNEVDLTTVDYSKYHTVGAFLLKLYSSLSNSSTEENSGSDLETLIIDGKTYKDYLVVNLSGKIRRVK